MFRPRLAFSAAIVLAATLVPAVAAAQTVSASGQPYPNRIVNGNNEGYSTRPQNLNPLGISYADCMADMTLSFSVTLSGFTASSPDSLEVWASLTSDCTAMTDRGIGATAALCWGTRSGNLTSVVTTTPQTYTFNVRVQDLVGWQQGPPPVSMNTYPPAKGIEACSAQATFAAVPMNINFLAIDSSGNSDGTPYQYTINTDMVGPPAPSGMGETVGETIYNVTWTANSDSDTAGYDIFIDPYPGQEGAEGGVVSLEGGQKLVCPDTGAAPVGDATLESGGADGANDGPMDSSTAESGALDAGPLPYDGACYPVNTGGQSPASASGYNCNDPTLAGAITQDGGADAAAVVTTPVTDDGGSTDEGGTVETGVGGITTVGAQYLYPPGTSFSSGFTIADKSVGSYTIKGLIDGIMYNVVVSAVDGTGNVGPPSVEVCDYPAPVRDFWQTYQEDGGGPGGFCALETIGAGGAPSLAGVAGVVGLAAFTRRRRRRSGK